MSHTFELKFVVIVEDPQNAGSKRIIRMECPIQVEDQSIDAMAGRLAAAVHTVSYRNFTVVGTHDPAIANPQPCPVNREADTTSLKKWVSDLSDMVQQQSTASAQDVNQIQEHINNFFTDEKTKRKY